MEWKMLGEIDTSNTNESATIRLLDRLDGVPVSCGRTIFHVPRFREVPSSDIRGRLRGSMPCLQPLSQLLPMRKLRQGRGCLKCSRIVEQLFRRVFCLSLVGRGRLAW